ncbi:MAG: YqgE/AlgH family protein [Nitrospinaceae bacterium]|nr:YqgE/AlgH family protein [Nitrospinaceae bacterium]NIR56108.1 YqgE/AlgH family protein [Nitrospinaceae bacterium]NIS86556.1 YqgE/AlgH family protein [Nitrospinaceae bacterium]NIT83390.1 YqgE/AlgH family protein [Nitrospinaceae bacterium]NIU45600.1 YqgE/AlgH family protein [Nitrospinaceae bacterium]
MDNGSYGKGSFLVANPVLPDPNFSRTVVLLCNHNDKGSLGLVINRKSGLTASEVFASSELLAPYEGEVFIGGPVSPSQVFYLCRAPRAVQDLDEIYPGVYMGMSWDALEEIMPELDNPDQDLRFYLGYSGWASGQLAGEMEQRSWLTCDALDRFVFHDSEEQIWPGVVQSLGKDYEYLLRAPLDPRNN